MSDPLQRCGLTHQASLSMKFSRQEYTSGLPFPSPGELPDPGIKHTSLMSHALALSNPIYKSNTTITKTRKDTAREENSRPILLVNIDTKSATKYYKTKFNSTLIRVSYDQV